MKNLTMKQLKMLDESQTELEKMFDGVMAITKTRDLNLKDRTQLLKVTSGLNKCIAVLDKLSDDSDEEPDTEEDEDVAN